MMLYLEQSEEEMEPTLIAAAVTVTAEGVPGTDLIRRDENRWGE